ncbi:MAG: hypothetical protein J2P17_31760, partial [Mycobacterium sp.]|nr:hypothetical protein [Mycobacterium sp.]
GTTSADRWAINIAGTDTCSVSRDTTNVDSSSGACAAVTFTLGTGGGATAVLQGNFSDAIGELKGRTVSFSMRVRTSTANAARLAVNNYYASTSHYTYSSFHSGNGTYQTLTVTVTLDPTATLIQLLVYFAATCTAYLDNAMLVVGSQPANYVPLHPADDLARCLRYYQILSPPSNADWAFVIGLGPANSFQFIRNYLQQMGGTPTVTISAASTWHVNNGSATMVPSNIAVWFGTTNYVAISGNASTINAGSAVSLAPAGAGASLVAEWNP